MPTDRVLHRREVHKALDLEPALYSTLASWDKGSLFKVIDCPTAPLGSYARSL